MVGYEEGAPRDQTVIGTLLLGSTLNNSTEADTQLGTIIVFCGVCLSCLLAFLKHSFVCLTHLLLTFLKWGSLVCVIFRMRMMIWPSC
ncbi:hypothetical protein VNO78_34195 [Psophocarpus tetragonolobus]|uniref:Uncharacterized protein n=1 Tax=Psophocarpus tetragonolobus TaxID=3891 RepID=A0AAN9NV68_PSOTE